jgi:hypothetical protein
MIDGRGSVDRSKLSGEAREVEDLMRLARSRLGYSPCKAPKNRQSKFLNILVDNNVVASPFTRELSKVIN